MRVKVTMGALAALSALAVGCSGSADPAAGNREPSGAVASAPVAQEAGDSAATARSGQALQGVWSNADGSVRLTLRQDGTFSEDYQGTRAAYEGRFTVDDGVLTLRARTGERAEATVERDSLRLNGEELTRRN